MKISLIYINSKNSVYDTAIDEYKKRLSRYADFTEIRFEHSDIKKESESIYKKIEESDFVVLLDEIGSPLKSINFAEFIDNKMNMSTKRLIFVIGGAYGAAPILKERANYILKLSDMVLPHELARLLLIEQIYRAYSILNNSPYHHK